MILTRAYAATGRLAGFAAIAALACAAFLFSGLGAAHAATVATADAATTTPATSTAASSSSTASTASASSPAPAQAADTCGVTTDDIAQIVAVQNDPSLSASQEVVAELALRKTLVSKVIACAQGETASLRKALAGVHTSGNAAQGIQSQLQGRVADADHFYAIELSKLNDAGIAGTEGIAGEVLAWRGGTYGPLAGQVGDFILWNANQPLFTVAQTRMDQTQQAVSFLEGASANAALQQAFNDAYASFQSAKQENAAAEQALQQSLPPDQTLALIKQSLADLQTTYQKFFAVSGIIQTLLPQ